MGTLSRSALSEEFLFEALGTQGLAAPPGAGVSNDFPVLVIKRDRGSLRLDDEELAYQVWRGAVAIAVELQAKILGDEGLHGIAVIGREGRQRTKSVGGEAVDGTRASLAMQALVSDFLQPLPRLTIDIGQVRELAEGPEVLTNVPHAPALHFTFFPAGAGITGPWKEAVLAGKGQEARMKADQGTVVLRHSGRQIVVPTFTSGARTRIPATAGTCGWFCVPDGGGVRSCARTNARRGGGGEFR